MSLSEYLAKAEDHCVEELLRAFPWDENTSVSAQQKAIGFINVIRATRRKPGSLEAFFQQYALNTDEGIALMALAEALLRIPDGPTAKDLIRDKVASTKWLRGVASDKDWLTRAAGLGLSVSGATMNSLFSRLGEPVIRQAIAQAMKVLGKQFIVGKDIKDAIKHAKKDEVKGYRFSYDMLGEGARTSKDAQEYFDAYEASINALSKYSSEKSHGISVKLSALHPRYEYAQEDICVPELQDRLLYLCKLAAQNNIPVTVDAEEVDRLETSLKIIEGVLEDPNLKDWQGFGMAVQAYQKRCYPLLQHIVSLAQNYQKRIQIRLVKGAYWDTEIKRAQVLGLEDYPVFTRKRNTDLSFLACAHFMLHSRDTIYPMFGTHNAHSVAAILDMAGNNMQDFEFQRLHGMGEALYSYMLRENMCNVSVYAPVGAYEDLLPYLVRRLLENGANSSFVNQIYDTEILPKDLAVDPVNSARNIDQKHHPKIPLPSKLFGEKRKNSKGLDLTDDAQIQELDIDLLKYGSRKYEAASLITGKDCKQGSGYSVTNPADQNHTLGTAYFANANIVNAAFSSAQKGFEMWSQTSAEKRAQILEKFADLLEQNMRYLMSLCVYEAGKTLADSMNEVREAVDFCRYYAAQGRMLFDEKGMRLPGPTGERNMYYHEPRGVFVCISPWNFPLAIFTGQISAALMAGNAVIAKPAEQTCLIAYEVIKLLIKAGVPKHAINLVLGDGNIGAQIVQHRNVSGVAFTGSTEAAKSIQKTLADKDGPIVPLIAETGGQNAMIVDSSALTEQVVDDVIASAFGATGQRCSACRVLYLADPIVDKTLQALKGALEHIRIGDPSEIPTDIGPVIDEQAKAILQKHKSRLEGFGKKIAQAHLSEDLKQQGCFFAPIIYEIPGLEFLKHEVFGPVLHVIRYDPAKIDDVIDEINNSGYGLTFGVHTRVNKFAEKLAQEIKVGNVYVNRTTIGAIVGSQPFGGHGLSGTGPKAGGPNYLHAFATEKVVSIDTTAAGGNASLVMLND